MYFPFLGCMALFKKKNVVWVLYWSMLGKCYKAGPSGFIIQFLKDGKYIYIYAFYLIK